MVRQILREPRRRQPLDDVLDSVESWFTARNDHVLQRRAVDTPEASTHSIHPKRSSSSLVFPISTALVIQILVLIAMVVSAVLFLVYRRRRQRRLKQLDEQKKTNAPFFARINAPNGLAPPPYGEALKSPAVSEAAAYGQQGPKTNSMLMDECWKAVYASEDGIPASPAAPRPGHASQSSWDVEAARVPGQGTGREQLLGPASPQVAAQTGARRPVPRWLRSQRWFPGGKAPPHSTTTTSTLPTAPSTPTSARLPVPPSPSYNGVTPSMVATPTTATYLIGPATPTPNQPLSARTWATGDHPVSDSVRSTFVPQTVLQPPPLQPAPKGTAASRSLTAGGPDSLRRASAESRSSLGLADGYDRESGTWKTITPGNPGDVSPI